MLSPFWSAAAALAGRVRLGWLRPGATPPDALSPAALAANGVALDHAIALARGASGISAPAITLVDAEYPAALRQLERPPPVLFHEGDLSLLHAPALAVVGTRRCSEDGARVARTLAGAIAAAGGVVVSGGAWGVDEEAHLAAQGRTIVVLGQGLAAPHTERSARLTREVLQAGGLVLSELPPSTHASPYTFPQRNRIVAALGSATIVVEAGHRSGSLITARFAAELGREVWACPGSPGRPEVEGCLDLLEAGARLYRGPRSVLHHLRAARASHSGLAAQLRDQPDLATLQQRSGLPLPVLLRQLAALELEGVVHRLPGDRFALQASGGAS
jgi:DNA processing protein